jgi:hypothetical protein
VIEFRFPETSRSRRIRYWLKWTNLWAARHRYFRRDFSNEWRYKFGSPDPPDRSVDLRTILSHGDRTRRGFRFIILADSGEGDRSQYGLLPLIRACAPDFLVINGDVAYPCARTGTADHGHDDFLHGFFEPYKNLHVPVWATPGNHEYYSPFSGREFYEVFCTRRFDNMWDEFGLRHAVLQPGMFWELDDLHRSGLVIIGIDSGKNGNLDGRPPLLKVVGKEERPDLRQLAWLDQRLRRTQDESGKAIVLFHVPALSRESVAERNLQSLHAVLAKYPCVKLVLCGHEHHHEQYSAETFRRFLERECVQRPLDPEVLPRLVINGGGGGYLQSTDFPAGEYPGVRYPTSEQWRAIASRLRTFSGRFFRDKGIVSRLMGTAASDIFMDSDEPSYLSFILVEVDWSSSQTGRIRVIPVFLHHLNDLYPDGYLPDGTVVDVQAGVPPPDPARVLQCRQDRAEPDRDRMDLSFEL